MANNREEVINQLRTEGQLEAARSFAKFQSKKIEELKFIKTLFQEEQCDVYFFDEFKSDLL